ncbi:expressed unknown protein [Seminavis robusta]|uniref:Uncharacterized protein n=1 Tax=Seminavis robusta TaxID=568900 RepID=A0A9N8EYX0_9STRA|nr:expressed unknown protein [Seminavis robusta]|eukprot:Sro2016_g311140.1 n/a (458) ;mRNA; r:4343-5716
MSDMRDHSNSCSYDCEPADDATVLSSSINSFVLRRMQSSAMLKWQNASSHHHHRASTKEGTEIAIIGCDDGSLQDNDDDDLFDNDDECSVVSQREDSFANDCSAGSFGSGRNSTSSSTKKKSYHKLISKKLGSVQNLLDEDSDSDDDSLAGVNTSRTSERSPKTATTKDRSDHTSSTSRKTRSASPIPSPSRNLRRIKSSDSSSARKAAVNPKKMMRKVVSTDAADQYRQSGSIKNKRMAALTAASSHSSSSPKPTKSGLKRCTSDLGGKKSKDVLKGKPNLQLKRSASSGGLASTCIGNDNVAVMPKRSPRVSISLLGKGSLLESTKEAPNLELLNLNLIGAEEPKQERKKKLTRAKSSHVLGSRRSNNSPPPQKPRRKIHRSVSAKEDNSSSKLEGSPQSCHARTVTPMSAPKKPTRRPSSSKKSSRSPSPNSASADTLPCYDWQQGKPLTSPSA